ncbi:type IV toxin-antitoxin system AbiEi family antitoxin domain-containing protein [Arthrobacter sp. GMC3]|uniref:type IV toxin-antitoxin system AbiEi family antitoxin domain-containing protein n=1 Tax=Arthrobacter sp. GMC3 TaxID=2058894 RepID=UPI0011B06385|nr:type IV toxin-antitoxin system AbiEi family antitoxin domain-containing protein [Arthrobacter sp. GMC3]
MDIATQQKFLAEAWPKPLQVATTEQLREAGVGDRLLASALKRGLVFRLRKGAYVQAATWQACPPWGQSRLRLAAHLATTRGTPVYSYYSAARLHGLYVWNCGAQVHITGPSPMSGTTAPKDVATHHQDLPDADVCTLRLPSGREVRATTLERTVVDCARIAPFAQAVVIGDSALHLGANLDVMVGLLAQIPGRRGVRKARRVLAALDKRSESPGESRTRLVIAEMNVPQPELQVQMMVRGAVYRPDFVWNEQKVIVEFDGKTKYFDYKPTAEVLLAERRRESLLMEAGWRFVRFTWDDLRNPESMKRRLGAVLAPGGARVAA